MTTLRNTQTAWGGVAKLFHWLGALLVLFLTADGWWMTHLAERAGRLQHYELHSVIGYYLLLLLALRLAWRVANPAPALPQELKRWERAAALTAHWLLYALMLAVSVSGWMVADTFRRPLEATLFGAVPVPHLLDASYRQYRGLIEASHEALSYVLLALVVVHVAGALRHHYLKKNDVLRRMSWGWSGR